MSELGHPIYGLYPHEKTEGHGFGITALNAIDLTWSLDRLNETDYRFENLYGLFAFANLTDIEPEARTTFGLYLLPRLYGKMLRQEDMMWFARRIAADFTVGDARADQVAWALSLSEERARSAWPDRPTEWHALAGACRGVTENATLAVANRTSTLWLTDALSSGRPRHWLVDGVVYQLMARPDVNDHPLVDHDPLGAYVNDTLKDHFAEIIEYSRVSAWELTFA